jgi:ketosteroid isomerase-like protein
MSPQEQNTNQADVAAITKVREAHIGAVNRGDVEAWVAAFSDEGVQMPSNAPANLGSPSIRAWSQAFLAPFRVQFCQKTGKDERQEDETCRD